MVLWRAASVPNGRELRDYYAAHEHAQYVFQDSRCFRGSEQLSEKAWYYKDIVRR
jgi:hypothetical protein